MKQGENNWTFFSNHGHVYFLLAMNKEITIREVALRVGITERTVIAIVQDLVDAKYLRRKKVGRTNQYEPINNKSLRHPLEKNVKVEEITKLIEVALKSDKVSS